MKIKENLRHHIALLASLVEVLLSALVLLAVLLVSWRLLFEVFDLGKTSTATEGFTTFLGHAFNVIIGIEFIKMLAKHTPGATIEVLLFSLAREMVVEHTTPVENLISIVTIALVFVIRKYLFVPSFGEHLAYHDGEPLSAFESDKNPEEHIPPSLLLEKLRRRAAPQQAAPPVPPSAAADGDLTAEIPVVPEVQLAQE